MVDPQPRVSVCIVGINYAPESTGIAPYTTAMAQALHRGGHEVSVVTGVPHYPQWRLQDERYARGGPWRETVDGVPVMRVRHHVPISAGVVGRSRMEASFLRRTLPIVRRSRAELLVAVTPSLAALVAARLGRRGRPLGVLVQDLAGRGAVESGTASRLVGWLVGAVETGSLRKADLVGVIAPRFASILAETGLSADRLVDLPNFTHIDPSALTPAQARERLGWDGTTVVLHTGNMGRKQGLEVMVEAAREAHAQGLPLRFVLMGDGNQRAWLQEAGREVSTLSILDPVGSDLYPVVLAAADVLVLAERPGVREMSLPSKLTSYVAARRPIVASVDREGITGRLLDEHGAAWVVAQDGGALLAGVRRVLADDELARSVVKGGERIGAEMWSPAAAAERYRGFVGRLASRD